MNLPEKIEGIGLGLRFPHFEDILNGHPQTPWFEVLTDDFLDDGPHHDKLMTLRNDYPVTFHSTGMNICGTQDFNLNYLNKFKELYQKFQPVLITDHLCWSSHNGKYHHDLLPAPRTQAGLINTCERINYLQDFFKCPLALENITSYIDYRHSDYSEIEFISQVIKATGCKLLLDISNVIINNKNRNKKYYSYFADFPLDSVVQIHLAGGESNGKAIIDTHSNSVGSEDINILKNIYTQGFNIPVLIERDANLPAFSQLEEERKKIEAKLHEI